MHLPPEQSSVQLVPESQTMSHNPPEQLTVHACDAEHVPEHEPLEQSQLASIAHVSGVSLVPGGIGFGRFGRPLPQATIATHATATSSLMTTSYRA